MMSVIYQSRSYNKQNIFILIICKIAFNSDTRTISLLVCAPNSKAGETIWENQTILYIEFEVKCETDMMTASVPPHLIRTANLT